MSAGLGATSLATVLASGVGYGSIAFLPFLVTHSTAVFVAYRVALGALVLALVALGSGRGNAGRAM